MPIAPHFRYRARMRIRVAAFLTWVWLATAGFSQSPAPSDAAPDLGQLLTQGMSEFQAGDYAKAAADLESLTLKAEFSPQLEPVFYTVGSAYFNAGNQAKAVSAFQAYLSKFPNGQHVPDAAFGIAQANFVNKKYDEAAAGFAALEKEPRYRDQTLFFAASASKEAGKIDQAIVALEKLTAAEIRSASSVRGATLLAQLYAQKGSSEKAIATINKLHAQIARVDNLVELNSTTVQLGDELYKKKLYADALACYRAAFPREQIVRMQGERIAAMQRSVEGNLAAARSDRTQFAQLGVENNQLKSDIARAQQLLVEFQKLPSITPAIYIRMGRCFYEIDKKWEAIVVYQEIVDRFQSAQERETALFGLIVALAEVNQPQKAQARCEQYLRDFKNGPNADTVGYLIGAVALEANDPKTAETYFGRQLAAQPKSSFREQMRYLLANAKFMAGKYDEATEEYKKYLNDFPKGQNVEDVQYRMALTGVFSGKYEDAMNRLNAFMQKYPKSAYVADAKYRLAVCKYAASLYDEVISDCKSWEAEFATNLQLGEVLALLADAYAATTREDQAIPIYVHSYKIAPTDEVMNYSLFAASKLMQKRDEWEKVTQLFTDFINDKPDHPTVISALFWIGKAKSREGKPDEAKKITADTIAKYIADPNREAVEMLLTQLAQLCVRKKRAVETPAPPTGDPGAELETLLAASAAEQAPTARARVLYAKAELARLRKQLAEEGRNIAEIATKFKPEDLSPVLLGRAGDHLVSQNQFDQATPFYQRLMDEFPKSENLDYAYAGLGEIAFAKKDYTRALHYFSDATEKIAASQKLKEVSVGKAKTFLAMGRLEDAKKAFEQVASVREWRGETTAFAVYSLGEIEAKRQRWAEANAYFQRVYVGYQKFLPWVAKAYIRSADSFEKLGKQQEAANTLRELLRNEKLQTFAEAEEAKRRLAAVPQG